MTDDNNFIFGDNEYESKENIEHLINFANLRKAQAEVDEHMRTLSTNKQDPIGMRLHMINSHQFSVDNTTWADEGLHEGVPRIQHKMRMMQGDAHYPKLDHEDMLAWHHHDHTAGEFADEYPSEDTGEEHKHL